MKKLVLISVLFFSALCFNVQAQIEERPVEFIVDTSPKDLPVSPGGFLTQRGRLWVRLLTLKTSGKVESAILYIADEGTSVKVEIKAGESLYLELGNAPGLISKVTFMGIFTNGHAHFKTQIMDD